MERYVNPETNDDSNLQLPLVEQNHKYETLLYVASHHDLKITIVLNCRGKTLKARGYDAIVKDNSYIQEYNCR